MLPTPSPGQAAPPCLMGEQAGGSLRCAQPKVAQELSVVSGCSCARGVPGQGPRLCQALLALLRARGGLCLREAQGDAAYLLSASQNDYRIDPNQELLAMGKRPLGAGGQGVGIRPKCRRVSHSP